MIKTSERIIESATALLDAGGVAAVTLRAVGQASGVSHNAPYKHFANRDAVLGEVATREFQKLAATFAGFGRERVQPLTKLKRALQAFSEYGRDYAYRYQLLFSDPAIAQQEGALAEAAMAAFSEFAKLVAECQQDGSLPGVPAPALAGLLYASVHGLIDLQASGRMKTEKGFKNVSEGIALLLTVLATDSAR